MARGRTVRKVIDIRWNPLDEDAPVVLKCPACGGRLSLYDQKTDENYTCHVCVATPGLAPPPACGECGGKGDMPPPGESPSGLHTRWTCPTCSGTGHAPWGVLVTLDVFATCACFDGQGADDLEWVCDDFSHELPALFATIAAHPEMQFHLPLETVASAERARGWIKQIVADRDSPFYVPYDKRIPSDLLLYPHNLTLLAVAHDQPSLDEVLPTVLAVPGAHGVYLKALDGAVDLKLHKTEHWNRALSREEMQAYADNRYDISTLLIDAVSPTTPWGTHLSGNDLAQLIMDRCAVIRQVREAGVPVVKVKG
jgi:hypothetical protein